MGLAHLLGTMVRSLGSGVRSLDPERRRDGTGLALVALGVVIAAAFWFMLPGAFGDAVRVGVATIVGAASVVVPLACFALAFRTLRDPEANGPAGRQPVGWLTLALGVLGLVSIAKDIPSPTEPERLQAAGGVLGFISSSFLADLLTVWVAMPLLVLVSVFGLLVITGIPLREFPERLAALRARLPQRPERSELTYGVDEASEAVKKGNKSLLNWTNKEITKLNGENFFEKDYNQELKPYFGSEVKASDIILTNQK